MSKYEDLSGLSDDELIDRYVANTLEHVKNDVYALFLAGVESSARDSVAGNAAATRMGAVYSELRRRGRSAQERLLDLLNHPDDSVKKCVQGLVMEFAPERIVPIYEELAAQGGFEGSGAEYALREWREGRRKLRPDFLYRSHPTVAESERWPAVSQEVANVLGAVGNRLDAEAPDLGQAFRQASLDRRRFVAIEAIGEFVSKGVLEGEKNEGGVDEVQDAQYALHFEKLPAPAEHERMTALGSRLRAELALVEGDPDKTGIAEVLRLAAHAASALAIALTGDSTRLDEVILEAIGAHNQPESFIPYLAKMLREPQKN